MARPPHSSRDATAALRRTSSIVLLATVIAVACASSETADRGLDLEPTTGIGALPTTTTTPLITPTAPTPSTTPPTPATAPTTSTTPPTAASFRSDARQSLVDRDGPSTPVEGTHIACRSRRRRKNGFCVVSVLRTPVSALRCSCVPPFRPDSPSLRRPSPLTAGRLFGLVPPCCDEFQLGAVSRAFGRAGSPSPWGMAGGS